MESHYRPLLSRTEMDVLFVAKTSWLSAVDNEFASTVCVLCGIIIVRLKVKYKCCAVTMLFYVIQKERKSP
jgi:hypothetical protein